MRLRGCLHNHCSGFPVEPSCMFLKTPMTLAGEASPTLWTHPIMRETCSVDLGRLARSCCLPMGIYMLLKGRAYIEHRSRVTGHDSLSYADKSNKMRAYQLRDPPQKVHSSSGCDKCNHP